jgi:hypothetical protein
MRCQRTLSWIGQCSAGALPDNIVCKEHAKDKCWCGAVATRDCSNAGSFVCGRPLCKDHECPGHDPEGKRQWVAYREGNDALVAYDYAATQARERVATIIEEVKMLKEQIRERAREGRELMQEYHFYEYIEV